MLSVCCIIVFTEPVDIRCKICVCFLPVLRSECFVLSSNTTQRQLRCSIRSVIPGLVLGSCGVETRPPREHVFPS